MAKRLLNLQKELRRMKEMLEDATEDIKPQLLEEIENLQVDIKSIRKIIDTKPAK